MARTKYTDDYAGRLCEKYEEPMLGLARSDNGSSAKLMAALEAPPEPGAGYTRRGVSRAIVSQEEPTGRMGLDVVDLLVDLVVTSRASRTPLPALVTSTLSELGRVNPDLDAPRLAGSLLALSGTPSIEFLAISEDLLAENSRVYIDSRIIRDFRPVYKEDRSHEPVGISCYLSQQRLRIRYWTEGEERTFEITMRDDDLLDLEKWLFRAKKKLALVPDVKSASDVGDNG